MIRRPLIDLHDHTPPAWLQDVLAIAAGIAIAGTLLLAMAAS